MPLVVDIAHEEGIVKFDRSCGEGLNVFKKTRRNPFDVECDDMPLVGSKFVMRGGRIESAGTLETLLASSEEFIHLWAGEEE